MPPLTGGSQGPNDSPCELGQELLLFTHSLAELTESLKKVHSVRTTNGSTHSQKDNLEADFAFSLLKVLTEHAVLLVDGFKLAPRHGIFTMLDFHKMDEPLVGSELTKSNPPELQTLDKTWRAGAVAESLTSPLHPAFLI